DEIAKAIDFEDNTAQGAFIDRLGTRRSEAHIVGDLIAKAVGFDSFGKIRRDRREDIARVEGVTAGLQEIMVGGNVADGDSLFAIVDQRKHAIIGSHEYGR